MMAEGIPMSLFILIIFEKHLDGDT
jgi:hypothetical protein